MGPTESMLISTSVIWFSRRRQKPCCCALHFINHIFMWTRSGHLTAQTWAFAVARGPRHVYSPARLSKEQSSTLLITFDYFHLLGSVWLGRTAGGLISYKSRCLCRIALCAFRISTPLLSIQWGIPLHRQWDTKISPMHHYLLALVLTMQSIITYVTFLKYRIL